MPDHPTCPRCCRPIEPPGVTSRFEGANPPTVCNTCGELEAAVERYGWQITGPGQWPLGIGDLLLEHRLIYQDAQDAAGYAMYHRNAAYFHTPHLRMKPRRRRRRSP